MFNKKFFNKEAMEMTISAVIIIILALFVLSAVLFVFIRTEGGFRDTILGFLHKSNIDDMTDYCNLLVVQNAEYEYCCVKKEFKLEEEKKEISCFSASEENWGTKINKLNCENVCED